MQKTDNFRVLLVRGPRYYWPFINEYDNFLMPQSLACLAAAVRQAGFEVKVLDCMPMHVGWGSLKRIMEEYAPHVVGVGDSESLYSEEALKVVRLAKTLNPNVVTVGGGAHFSHMSLETVKYQPVDFVVRGEGEQAFVNLLKELQNGKPDLQNVTGITYRNNGDVIQNPPQPLVENLDDYPMPAYDLMPMSEYGKGKYLFDPGGVTAYHSRGCTEMCKFCVWWVQMGSRKMVNGEEVVMPRWRTKSVARMVEEMEVLVKKYNKRGFVFVDDSWNISARWGEEFAEEVLRRGLKFNWFAFMRADCMVRDEKLGVLRKLVRAGLRHICIGVERSMDEDLNAFQKPFYSGSLIKECFTTLKNKYPEIFRQATFIVGVRDESRESMLDQVRFAKEIHADYPGFHPLTPVPGTSMWHEAREKGWLEVEDFSQYDWMTPVMPSKNLTRQEIEDLIYEMDKKFATPVWLMKGLFSRHAYRRKMYFWWVLVMLRVMWNKIKSFANPFKIKEYTRLVKPVWYDK